MRVMQTRCWAVLVATTVIAAGCSGGGEGADTDAEVTAPVAPAGTDVPRSTAHSEPAAPDAPASEPAATVLATAPPTVPPTVPPTTVTPTTVTPTTVTPTSLPAAPQVSVDVAIGPNTTVVAGQAAVDAQQVDPFGEFAACSGLRDSVANWSLQVSDPGEAVTAVSILTAAGVTGPGDYDGTFRVEFVNGAALDGVGTVTLDAGLQSGTFAARDADLRGSFACTGAPEPVALDTPDVEVVALMRRGSAERMVSLAEPYSDATSCAEPAGRVRVAGDAGIGGLVELTIDAGALVISIGGVDVGIDPARTELAVDGPTGTFHAVTLDGMEIDGAFTCAPSPTAPAPIVS